MERISMLSLPTPDKLGNWTLFASPNIVEEKGKFFPPLPRVLNS